MALSIGVDSEGRSVTGARLYINCKPSPGTWALALRRMTTMLDGNDDKDLQNGGMLQLKELLKRKQQGKCLVEHMRPDHHMRTMRGDTAGFFTYRITKQFPMSPGFSGLFFGSCGGIQQREELSMEFQEAFSFHEVAAALVSAGLDVDIEIASSEEAQKKILGKNHVKAWYVVNSMQTAPVDTNKDISFPTLLTSFTSVSLPVRKTMEQEGKCQRTERAAEEDTSQQ